MGLFDTVSLFFIRSLLQPAWRITSCAQQLGTQKCHQTNKGLIFVFIDLGLIGYLPKYGESFKMQGFFWEKTQKEGIILHVSPFGLPFFR